MPDEELIEELLVGTDSTSWNNYDPILQKIQDIRQNHSDSESVSSMDSLCSTKRKSPEPKTNNKKTKIPKKFILITGISKKTEKMSPLVHNLL